MRFADLLGQEGMVRLLKARLREGTALDTNYVFAGAHGSGKTTSARILAKAILCERITKGHPDPEPCNECDNCTSVTEGVSNAYTEQDAASNGTIDHVRSIVDDLPFAVMGAVKRIYCFDEMHRMSSAAQDVLLKPLEEKRLVGMFCTTEPEKIRGPIRSRCEEHTIRKATREELLTRMKWVLAQENVEHEDEAVSIVIDHAGGHVRDILNRLEMIAQVGSIDLAAVREYLNLGTIAMNYEILLALTEPKQAVDLIEKASGRVSADEIATGLAEAALATFRLANGMTTDLVFVDRTLAQQVYAKYGQHVLRLADHFARVRASSKALLITDVLSLAQSGGRVPDVQPTMVLVANGSHVASVAVPSELTPVAPASPTVDAPSAKSQVATPLPPAASKPPSKPPMMPGYPSGVGPIGVDPLALTDLDHLVVGAGMPRNSKIRKDAPLPFDEVVQSDHQVLTPAEWANSFRKFWLREA